MTPADRCVRATVQGRVQGVGFRWFVQARARARDLAGWVSNEPDGSVTLVASGPAMQIQALLEEVRGGPPRSAVTALQVRDVERDDSVRTPFYIRREA